MQVEAPVIAELQRMVSVVRTIQMYKIEPEPSKSHVDE